MNDRVDSDCSSQVDLRVRLGSVELPNPIIAASGTFGHGAEFARVCPPTELGAITVKSLAPFPSEGNPPLRVAPLARGAMINSVGLPGPGVEAWIRDEWPRLERSGARVIVSVWGRSVDDYARAANMLGEVAARVCAVEVNLSCPNLGGHEMFAQSPALARDALRAVSVELPAGVTIFAKLTAAVADIVGIATAAIEGGATGLTVINTMPGFSIDPETATARLGAGNGGVSGPPLREIALRAVHDIARAIPGAPIIGTGGVTSGVDAISMLMVGASAVGVGTATFAEPSATIRIVRETRDWCAAHGVSAVASLVGAADRPEANLQWIRRD